MACAGETDLDGKARFGVPPGRYMTRGLASRGGLIIALLIYTSAVRLHPNLAALYRLKVYTLHEALDHEARRAEAFEILRTLIDKVVVHPQALGGFEIEIVGEIAAMVPVVMDGPERKSAALGGPAFERRWLRGRATGVVCSLLPRECRVSGVQGIGKRHGTRTLEAFAPTRGQIVRH